jgi:hypothetical protein
LISRKFDDSIAADDGASFPAALVSRGNKGRATPRNLLHCTTIGFF